VLAICPPTTGPPQAFGLLTIEAINNSDSRA